MTIDTQTDPGYEGPQVYSGVRKDGRMLTDTFLAFQIPWIGFTLVDLPFSFLADTVLLPVTLPRDRERARKLADESQVATERPSAIPAVAGEAPTATAVRLFTQCARLLHDQDPHLADCYSIDAKVEITGSEPMRGADYKQSLREALARDRSDSEIVEWRDPSYAADGERVRISAKRASSSNANRLPVSLVVGPGSDGGWRILEEIGPGLTRQ
jgi:uncharacterized protein YceK